MSDKIKLTKDDVSLVEIPKDECYECGNPTANYYLQIDLRGLGMTTSLGDGRYCEPCGQEALARIQATL